MVFTINFNEEKNQLLKATRGVSFEDVLKAIKDGKLLADISHPSRKYPRQKLYVVEMNGYIFAVPYVLNVEKQAIFLKTIYPSRALTKIYRKGEENEKTKK